MEQQVPGEQRPLPVHLDEEAEMAVGMARRGQGLHPQVPYRNLVSVAQFMRHGAGREGKVRRIQTGGAGHVQVDPAFVPRAQGRGCFGGDVNVRADVVKRCNSFILKALEEVSWTPGFLQSRGEK